jgi:hypothetical protein
LAIVKKTSVCETFETSLENIFNLLKKQFQNSFRKELIGAIELCRRGNSAARVETEASGKVKILFAVYCKAPRLRSRSRSICIDCLKYDLQSSVRE